jgi:uncharacterized membrane protein
MKNSPLKELFLILISLIPIVYLGINYSALPERVATHFNADGVANGFSPKTFLWLTVILFSVLGYGLMKILRKLDPKKNFDKFEGSFNSLRIILAILMSFLGIIIVNAAINSSLELSINYLLIGISLFVAILGNYMQTIKPNYMVGIRTPWTLNSDEVWRKTHLLGGKMMFYCGLVTAIILFFVPKTFVMPVFLVGILGSALVPIVYSYIVHKELEG